MKNVKFRGIPRQKPKFRGSARNSAGRGKLWALLITLYTICCISDPKKRTYTVLMYHVANGN